MQIRIRATGAVVYESEFRSLHPNTAFPQILTAEVLDEAGADPVLEGPQAQPTRYQTAYRDGVEEINGQWFTKYSVADMEPEAAAAVDANMAAQMRADRDKRLAATDWRFRSDLTPSQEWKDYCQALRDITTQAGFPFDINWPQEPN